MPELDSEAIDFRAASESFAPEEALEEAVGFVETHSMHGAEIGRLRRKENRNLRPLLRIRRRSPEETQPMGFERTVKYDGDG